MILLGTDVAVAAFPFGASLRKVKVPVLGCWITLTGMG
jgi:hypothetical protein